jgi:hypothetical protein
VQDINSLLASSGTDAGAIGAQFGLTPEQTKSAMASLLPAVAGGFQKRADAGDVHQVAQLTGSPGQPSMAAGNDILGQIFGSKDVSRQVAGHAEGQSGVSSAVLKALLPIVASMVAQHFLRGSAGGLGGAAGSGGGLGGILGSVLGGSGGGLGGMLGGSGSNPLDEILGSLTGAGRR